MIAIGEAFRNRNSPVIEVLSSQWCRYLENAELMDVGPVAALTSFFRDRSTADAQTTSFGHFLGFHSLSIALFVPSLKLGSGQD